jgi:hypothetical protein
MQDMRVGFSVIIVLMIRYPLDYRLRIQQKQKYRQLDAIGAFPILSNRATPA